MNPANAQTIGRAALLLTLPLCIAAAALGQPAGARERTDGAGLRQRVHAGRYANHRFGFSFLIPNGLRGIGAPDYFPQDGVRIDLSPRGAGVGDVRVYGEYDGLMSGSPRAVAVRSLKSARERSPAVRLLRWQEVRLGGFRAVRFAYEFKERSSREAMICDHVVAFRQTGNGADTFFNVTLTTTRRRYSEDRKTFEKVLSSWRAAPVL